MSHFCVLVSVPENDGDMLKAALQPYHEFECTGEDDQFVQDVEQLAEYKESYEKQTLSRLRAPDGSLHEPWDDKFYRDLTEEESKKIGPIAGSGCGSGLSWTSKDWRDGKGYRTKVKFTPEGYEEVEVPAKDTMTFVQFIQDETGRPVIKEGSLQPIDPDHDADQVKYGYIKVNESGEVVSVIDRTNPNKRWDWWVVGGRFSNHLRLKAAEGGEIIYADSAKKSDVDFDAMIQDGKNSAEETYSKAMRDIEGGWEPWESFLARRASGELTIEEARELYHAQASLKKANENLGRNSFFFNFDNLLAGKDEYVRQGGDNAITTFAILHNGKWFERGEMGMFGCVSDEKDKGAFQQGYMDILNSIPDDHYLVVVDCHI